MEKKKSYNVFFTHKNPKKKMMVRTIAKDTKREGQRKAKKCTSYRNQKRKKLIPLMVGTYLTHNPFNVTCTQIM
jgi:hypothetical protein